MVISGTTTSIRKLTSAGAARGIAAHRSGKTSRSQQTQTTGRISPGENAQLASYLRAAWRHLASRHEVTWRHVKGHSGHKWNDYVDKQADLGRSGARDCDAPEWQDESIPTDADDGESSTVSDDMPFNGGGVQPSHSTTSVMGPLATPMTHPTPPKTNRRLAPRPRRLKPPSWSRG